MKKYKRYHINWSLIGDFLAFPLFFAELGALWILLYAAGGR